MSGNSVVGTCSWTDKTMIQAYYPRGVSSAEARLRYYASRFDTVEVDSTYYGLPQRAHAENWARRTPDDFTFHIKAYGLMTGHAVDERALHPELRDYSYSVSRRGRVYDAERSMVERAFEIFARELEPLRDAGKLGGVLLQFPPSFQAQHADERRENLRQLDYAGSLVRYLTGAEVMVEFRHPSWVEAGRLENTLRFLRDRQYCYVSVDAPQFPDHSTMPPISAATGPWAYVRLHGRNRETWGAQTASAADRFDHLYSGAELREWDRPVRALSGETDRTFVMFNNCKYDFAPRNAAEMAVILGDVVAPRPGGAPTGEPGIQSGADRLPLRTAASDTAGESVAADTGQLDLGI
ncbi:MAG: DUF72 domain-containing protein [Actinomycetota bacterium]|jgi:uncharacterized protein YecE (DUF72 family)|nr:DUF72 domain-containing protein [Actinomycetota bacterium]